MHFLPGLDQKYKISKCNAYDRREQRGKNKEVRFALGKCRWNPVERLCSVSAYWQDSDDVSLTGGWTASSAGVLAAATVTDSTGSCLNRNDLHY